MKRIITKQHYFKSLLNVVNQHATVFEGKRGLQSIKTDFEYRVRRISEIISDISRPVSIFYRPKQYAEERLNYAMKVMTGMGCMAASINGDAPMLAIMHAYNAQLNKVSAYRLYVNAMHVTEELKKVHVDTAGKDFHEKKLPAFRQQVKEFGVMLETLSDQLRRRKSLKIELATLIADTNRFLRYQMDAIVRFNSADYLDFYREYMLIRREHKRKRPSAGKTQPEVATESKDICQMDTAQSKPLQQPALNKDLLPHNPVQETVYAVKQDHETEAVAKNETPQECLAEASLSPILSICRSLCSVEVMLN